MNFSPMRFKTFVWPHNPRVYTAVCQREMAVNKIPFGRCRLQSLGETRKIFRGEGEFVGGDAYDRYKELEKLFREDTPGMLVHPVWMAAEAWFVKLELEQEPRSDYVRYSFEFWEESNGGTAVLTDRTGEMAAREAGEPVWHTVAAGENLWSIAVRYGTTVENLLALNGAIGNPNGITGGQKVRVA